MNIARSVLLALAALTLHPTLAVAGDCEGIKNAQRRLGCYDAAANAKSGTPSPSNDVKPQNTCRGFEVASNALKLSLEGGTLRNDMLASGISELIAKREECRLSAKGQLDNATYEQNINAFQDIYQALRVTDQICRTDRIASIISNCSANIVTLSSGGITYGCNVFYKPIPRHRAWIEQHCGGRDTAANLISYILAKEVTVY
jgi:hypothetical protein